MPNQIVPVFVSYHGSDVTIAKRLKDALESISDGQFEVFVDKYSIEPGELYEQRIAEEIARAEWFLIVCTGFPRKDADMMWSFFEAGRFCATLPSELVPHASKRLVCLFDREPPAILSHFQGIHVDGRQRSGQPLDPKTPSPRGDDRFDDTALSELLKQMLDNVPRTPLRDTTLQNVKQDLRENACELIKLFLLTDAGALVRDQALQPRLSYELSLGGALTDDTVVHGFDGSLDTLFSIATDDTSWGEIVKVSRRNGGPNPVWTSDLEAASRIIADRKNPDVFATKCVLRGKIYRVFTARYEIYKSERRVVFIGFLPAVEKTFDLRRSSAILLSSLILSVRFREQLIPLAGPLLQAADPTSALASFHRGLLAVEIEAQQFGLSVDETSVDDAPLVSVVRDHGSRALIADGISQWMRHRRDIDAILSRTGSGHDAKADAAAIAAILQDIEPLNARFIETISEELLAQARSEGRGARPAVGRIAAPPSDARASSVRA